MLILALIMLSLVLVGYVVSQVWLIRSMFRVCSMLDRIIDKLDNLEKKWS